MTHITEIPTDHQLAALTTADPSPDAIHRTLARRSFATLATTSPAGHPHAAGVLYELVDGMFLINTRRGSRKARNVAAEPRVGLCIPVRRLPVGPPSSIQLQGTAEVLALDDPALVALFDRGALGSISGHGALELPDSCFLRITPRPTAVTYGLGLPLRQLIRNPLHAGGRVTLPQ